MSIIEEPKNTASQIGEVVELNLTVTDGTGRIHTLSVSKVEGQAPTVEMFGNNMLLTARLRMALAVVEGDFTRCSI